MCFQKICFILALLIAAANFSRAAAPSPASPDIPATPGVAAQTAAEGAKAKGEPQNACVQPQVSLGKLRRIAAASAGSETEAERLHQRRLLTGLIIGLLLVAIVYQFSRKQKRPAKAAA